MLQTDALDGEGVRAADQSGLGLPPLPADHGHRGASPQLETILESIGLQAARGKETNGQIRVEVENRHETASPANELLDAPVQAQPSSATTVPPATVAAEGRLQPAPSLSGEIAAVLEMAPIRITSLETELTRVRKRTEESITAAMCAAEASVRHLMDDVEKHAAERRRFAAAEAERIAAEVEQGLTERRVAAESDAKRIMDHAEQQVLARSTALDEYADRLARARCDLEELETNARRLAESLQEAAALAPAPFD